MGSFLIFSHHSSVSSAIAILLLFQSCGCDGAAELAIEPSLFIREKLYLQIDEGQPLNLTCSVVSTSSSSSSSTPLKEYKLEWHLRTFVEQDRLLKVQELNKLTLQFRSVQFQDRGEYRCSAKPLKDSRSRRQPVTKTISLNVRLHGVCPPNVFKCSNGQCLASRYTCDGRGDCPDAEDESITFCGHDPCRSKLKCENNRCMDPSLCCNPDLQDNCTVVPSCCLGLLEVNQYFYQIGVKQRARHNQALHYSYTWHIYTSVGCILAFVTLLTIIVFVVCRFHTKDRLLNNGNNGVFRMNDVRGTSRFHPPITLHDLDVYFASLRRVDTPANQGITYNINNGVQIVGNSSRQFPDPPPPYSSDPSINQMNRPSDPPPPYSDDHRPHEDQQALLLPDDNNNGDINGNSEMVDIHQVEQQRLRLLQSSLDVSFSSSEDSS